MAHDHDHQNNGVEYYLEQLFTIGVCGALGLVAVSLYTTGKLYLMLNPKFHPWVLAGGIGLMVMVVIRAIVVWNSIEEPLAKPVEEHAHGHVHDGHEACDHDHGHEHPHGQTDHGHSHSHGHDPDHEHAWGGPWRYVVLLLPAVLFLLGLPREGPSAAHANLTGLNFNKAAETGVLENVSFLQLEQASLSAEKREYMEGKRVSLIGRFAGDDPKRFTLSRFKINCCAADAIPLNAVILIDPDPKVPGLDPKASQNKWIQVTGLVAFLPKQRTNEFITAVLIQPKAGETLDNFIEEVAAPGNPYIN